MRNLKRALSLALASVMLLGMMVVGSSAAFSDADEIVNKEAVEITAGLGLFAGSDGKFDPKGTVTRAQMAAVIAKMFYGSDLNADTYKGGNKFSDTAAFEGGWAEGYINLGVEKGWFKGYGDGTFGPGNAVTTAEAVTMLLNLLKVDAGAGTWPMTVMAAAEDIELFDLEVELKPAPATNAAMTRDELAVIVWNALNYSAEGVQGYKVLGSDIVFKTWSDAAAFADVSYPDGVDADSNPDWDASFVSEVKNDTLAETVFEIQTATGYVTGNQATGEDYTIAAGVNVNLETGLDMLGHFVTVYYKEAYRNEKNPGVAYCLVEEAEYVTVDEAIGYDAGTGTWTGDKKDYLAAFGTKVEVTSLSVKEFDGANAYVGPVDYSETSFYAERGTYVISLETGKIVAFIAPVGAAIDTVTRVTTTAGKESIRLSTTLYQNNEDTDEIVEYDGIAEDDIVVVKNYNGVIYLSKPEVVTGKITKTGTVDGKAATYVDGKAYVNATVPGAAAAGMTTSYTPDANKTYDAYLVGGKLAGVILVEGAAALNDAVYVVDTYKVLNSGNYGSDKYSYYAQGVNAAGEEVTVLIGVEDCHEVGGDYVSDTEFATAGTNTGLNKFYTFEKSTDKEQAKKDVMVATEAKPESTFDVDVDEFFAETITGTVNPNELKKDDKYVTIGAGRVYLTADTKFVVVEANATTDELEIATYTGSIAKAIGGTDVLTVAASEDENGNYLAEVIVIVAANLDLNTEDYIYISDAAEADAAVVEGGMEVVAYFSATNEYKTIVVDDETAGFYTNYTIDEDGVYELNGKIVTENAYVKENEEFAGVFGTSINSTNIDLYNAAEAVVVDVRAADVVEDSEVAAIESLKDITSALKADYRVFFEAIVNPDGVEDVVTHIFVTSVQVWNDLNSDNVVDANEWFEA